MEHELHKKIFIDPGSSGRPSWYPTPPQDKDLLFYIQRNQNADTIVYRVNRTMEGLIHQHIPMEAYWIRYSAGGKRHELTEIQSRLAYGYESSMITANLYAFQFVSYQDLTFYISYTDADTHCVQYQYEGETIRLAHIYVYADEMGVFPVVKYIELYGAIDGTDVPHYRKIIIAK